MVSDLHIISSFEHSAFLELAINKLQEIGIEKEYIAAVPLEKIKEPVKVFDTIHRADGLSLFDLSAVTATIFSVIGASYGFVLKWGPIIWGLIGLGLGAILGFLIDLLWTFRKHKSPKTASRTEVVLIIKCTNNEFQAVKKILLENMALGIGTLGK